MTHAPSPELSALIEQTRGGHVVVVTGAGISAESGIPTFRGEEGYWTIGSRVYHPQEMATHAAFERMPREVWKWYLYRLGVCRGHDPNPAHEALARLEAGIGDRFLLATQNVDGLHLRAGNTQARTCQVHGNIDYMRAADGRDRNLYRVPDGLCPREREAPLIDAQWDVLVVPPDRQPARPHVLWFDEFYEEDLFRSSTALRAAAKCDLFVVIGSSGAAALPMHAIAEAARGGAAIVNVDPSPNPFGEFADDWERGCWVRQTACDAVPGIVDALLR